MQIADRFLARTALWPAEIAFGPGRLERWEREPWLREAVAPASTRAGAGTGAMRGGPTVVALLKELFRSTLRLSAGDYRSALAEGVWRTPGHTPDRLVRTLELDYHLRGEVGRGRVDVARTRWKIADHVTRTEHAVIVRHPTEEVRVALDAAVVNALVAVETGVIHAEDLDVIEALADENIVVPEELVLAPDATAWKQEIEALLARQTEAPDPELVASAIDLAARAPCELATFSPWTAVRARFERPVELALDPAWRPVVALAADLLARLLPDAEIRDLYLARRLGELADPSRWELVPRDLANLCSPERAARPVTVSGAFAHDGTLVDVAVGDRRWSWGCHGGRAHLPRVTAGPIILCAETWRVGADVRDYGTWRQTFPRFIEIANVPLPLPLDLDDEATPVILAELAPKVPELVVRELLPAPHDLGVQIAGRGVAHRLEFLADPR